LNSLHDPTLYFDLAKNLEFVVDYTCDSDMCIEINSSMPPISILFACINPYPSINSLPHKVITTIMNEPSNTDDFVDNVDPIHVFDDTLEVHFTAQVYKDFADTCASTITDLNRMFNL